MKNFGGFRIFFILNIIEILPLSSADDVLWFIFWVVFFLLIIIKEFGSVIYLSYLCDVKVINVMVL